MKSIQPNVTGRATVPSGQRWVHNAALARYLGVSVMTIWNWQRDSELDFPPPSRIGNRDYTDLSQIDEWMRLRMVTRKRARSGGAARRPGR